MPMKATTRPVNWVNVLAPLKSIHEAMGLLYLLYPGVKVRCGHEQHPP